MRQTYIILLCVFLCIFILSILLYKKYHATIQQLSVKNKKFIYDIYLKEFIQVVGSKDHYFMNYGLWDQSYNNITVASEKLVLFVLDQLPDTSPSLSLSPSPSQCTRILDVGCGYGIQDFILHNKYTKTQPKRNVSIVAVDISKKQIRFADRKRKRNKIKTTQLRFKQGDAMKIHEYFQPHYFDSIVSIESAFHYPERTQFFKHVFSLLKPSGCFVIADIVIKPDCNIFTRLVMKVFLDFWLIPSSNVITADEYTQNLVQSGFTIQKKIDITDKTFNPFYSYFLSMYLQKKHFTPWIGNMILSTFLNHQPFSYIVVVCSKT